MEKEVRANCKKMKKARIVKNDEYKKKEYLGKCTEQTKKMLKMRMNMCKVPENYKQGGCGTCPLCQDGEGSTEHYFQCSRMKQIAKVWNVNEEELGSQDVRKMKDLATFLEKVEIMLSPLQNRKEK